MCYENLPLGCSCPALAVTSSAPRVAAQAGVREAQAMPRDLRQQFTTFKAAAEGRQGLTRGEYTCGRGLALLTDLCADTLSHGRQVQDT